MLPRCSLYESYINIIRNYNNKSKTTYLDLDGMSNFVCDYILLCNTNPVHVIL